MAILDFQRPDKVIMIQADDFKGQFEFRPLEPGYGITIGNALRRILLVVVRRVCDYVYSELKELITNSALLKVLLKTLLKSYLT